MSFLFSAHLHCNVCAKARKSDRSVMRKWQGRLSVDCCHGLHSEAFIRASVRWTDAVAAGFHGAGIRAFSALYFWGVTEVSEHCVKNIGTLRQKVPYF